MTEPQIQQTIDGIRLIAEATDVSAGDILDALFFADIIEFQDNYEALRALLTP